MTAATLAEHLCAVFDHLGISRADIAAQVPSDVIELLARHPGRVRRLALVAPPRIETETFAPLGDVLLYLAPAGGMLGRTAASALPGLPAARIARLEDYDAESWSDLAVERPDLAEHLVSHFTPAPVPQAAAAGARTSADETSGKVAGIRYRALGAGPPLVLLPMAFAPSQWAPVLPELARRFRVVVLSGPLLGMLALLEQRARLTDWRAMCAGLFETLGLEPGHRVLEVGCGSGAISRQFCAATNGANPLTAIDFSGYALDEARLSAAEQGCADQVAFVRAGAEDLPFAEAAFDAAFAVTVFEECDAVRGLAEMVRVVRPGGRVAVIVRAIDREQWWNLDLPDDVRAKIAYPAPSVAAAGIATAGIHQLACQAGLRPLRCYSFEVASDGAARGPVIDYPEMFALSRLTPEERALYHQAKARAVADGTFFVTRSHHCFVGEVGRSAAIES